MLTFLILSTTKALHMLLYPRIYHTLCGSSRGSSTSSPIHSSSSSSSSSQIQTIKNNRIINLSFSLSNNNNTNTTSIDPYGTLSTTIRRGFRNYWSEKSLTTSNQQTMKNKNSSYRMFTTTAKGSSSSSSKSPLQLLTQAAMIPHPEKVKTGGEDGKVLFYNVENLFIYDRVL